jgi:FkbM family methyltransferase
VTNAGYGMIVNTRRLFARLLPALRVDAICDVGSMDGADALMFRGVLHRASIYAFEPNPDRFRLMQADTALRDHDIRLLPYAVTNYDGEAEFFLVEDDPALNHLWRGMSSLYRRSGRVESAKSVAVRTARLDTFLVDKAPPDARLALWIDTEGKTYEVIEGARGVAAQVCLLHVEVESKPIISPDQKQYAEVKALLDELGFVELATDRPPGTAQFNALFVRRELPTSLRLYVSAWLALYRARRCIGSVILSVCPACVRRLQSLRSSHRR